MEHMHNQEQTKCLVNRMSRAIGHLESIKKMINENRDCSEILIQISAVTSAINNIGKILLQEHLEHCVVEAIETGNKEILENFKKAIGQFWK